MALLPQAAKASRAALVVRASQEGLALQVLQAHPTRPAP
jgi:hypothetical protein